MTYTFYVFNSIGTNVIVYADDTSIKINNANNSKLIII